METVGNNDLDSFFVAPRVCCSAFQVRYVRSVYLLLLHTYGQKYTSPETEEQSSPDPICGLNSMESQFFHQDGTTSEFGSYKFKADFLRKLK